MRSRGLIAAEHEGRVPAGAGARRATLALAISTGTIILMWLLWSGAALAHTDLAATQPEDGANLTEPVGRIELEFSGALDSTGTFIRVLDADGEMIPVAIIRVSDQLVAVEPDHDLVGGRFAVLWSVRADSDGHEISGSFGFDVTTAGETTTDLGVGTDPIPTDEPTADEPTATGDHPAATGGASEPPTQPTTTAAPDPTTITDAAPAAAVEEDGTASDVFEWMGRWIAITGAIVGVGAIGFAATSLIGSAAEVRRAASWIRLGGILILAGSVVQLAALAVSQGSSLVGALMPWTWVDVLPTSQAYAMVLRVAGAIAMLQSPRMLLVAPGRPISDPIRAGGAMNGVGGRGGAVATTTRAEPTANRLEVQHEWLTLAGAAMVIVSFGLDGHTGDAGVIGRLASMTHVFAAGIWAGGLVVMADLLIRRRRSSIPTGVAEVAVRFSRVASAALVLAAVAGGALAWMLVDEPSELWSGAWGRILAVKLALVAVAAAIGGYNHFRVVPSLGDPSGHAADTLRRTVAVESVILMAVVAVTAVLVAAAP